MLRREITLEWQVVEDDDWDNLILPTSAASPHTRRRLGRMTTLVAVILLAVFAAGHSLTRMAEKNTSHIQTEIEDVMGAEAWASQNQNSVLAHSLIDSQAPEPWQHPLRYDQKRSHDWSGQKTEVPLPAVQSMELRGDLAMVEVLVRDSEIPWLMAPYRETRFYRQTAQGWLRTAPQTVFWGEAQRLETAHFRFEYHRRDAEVVRAVADRIEVLYAEQRRVLGLRPARPDTKTTIVITPQADPRPDIYCVRYSFSCDRPVVPSPHLLPLHEETTPATALLKLVAAALSVRSLKEALAVTYPLRRWMCHPIVPGLNQWISNRYNDLPSQRKHRQYGHVKEWLTANPVFTLTTLAEPECSYYDLLLPLEAKNCHAAVSATMIDYAVSRHGLETVPLLLDALRQHDSWESLIPAVYGVPVDEFEAGWQQYLETL